MNVSKYVNDAHENLRREQESHRAQFEGPPLLHALRAEVDEVDALLTTLLRRRMVLVEAIGFVKRAAGIEGYDPVREANLVSRFCPTPSPAQDAYREVIRVGRKLVQRQTGELQSPDDGGDSSDPR